MSGLQRSKTFFYMSPRDRDVAGQNNRNREMAIIYQESGDKETAKQFRDLILQSPQKVRKRAQLQRRNSFSANYLNEIVTNDLYQKQAEKNQTFLKSVKTPNSDTESDDLNIRASPAPFPVDSEEVSLRPLSTRTNIRAKTTDIFDRRQKIKIDEEFEGLWQIRRHGLPAETLSRQRHHVQCTQKELTVTDLYGNIKYHFHVTGNRSLKQLNSREIEICDSRFNALFVLTFVSSEALTSFKEQIGLEKPSKTSFVQKTKRLLGKKTEPVFGGSLTSLCKEGVPTFLHELIRLIELPNNISTEGVYRTSGNSASMQKIKHELDRGNAGVLQEYSHDVDVLASILKQFFRELKGQLFSYGVLKKVLEASALKSVEVQLNKIISILKDMPSENQQIFLLLFDHLLKVASPEQNNKMTAYNLAVCWGPTLVDCYGSSQDLVNVAPETIKFVDFLLNFYQDHRTSIETALKKYEMSSSRDNLLGLSPPPLLLQPYKKSSSNLSDDSDPKLVTLVEMMDSRISNKDEDLVGLYRKSGSKEKITKLLKLVSKNRWDKLQKHPPSIHDLAGVLKKFVVELPEPIISQEVIETNCDKSKDIIGRTTILQSPYPQGLRALCTHIIRLLDMEKFHQIPQLVMLDTWRNVFAIRHPRAVPEKCNKFFQKLLSSQYFAEHPLDGAGLYSRYSRYDNVDCLSDDDEDDIFLDCPETESTNM